MLKEFQTLFGLANKQAADLLGCSQPTIQKWRSGAIPVPEGTRRLLALITLACKKSPLLPDRLARQLDRIDFGRDEGPPSSPSEFLATELLKPFRREAFDEAMAELKRVHSDYFDALPVAAVVFDATDRPISVNRSFATLVSVPKETILHEGATPLMDAHSLGTLKKAIQLAREGRSCASVPMQLHESDGRVVETDATAAATGPSCPGQVVVLFRDPGVIQKESATLSRRLRRDRALAELEGLSLTWLESDPAVCIESALQSIARGARVETAFFWLIEPRNDTICRAYAWRNDSDAPSDRIDAGLPSDIAGTLQLLRERNRITVLDRSCALVPLRECDQLRSYAGASLLLAPLFDQGSLIGLVGLADSSEARSWHKEDEELAGALCDLLWSMRFQERHRSATPPLHQDYEAALRNARIAYWRWHVPSGVVQYSDIWGATLGMDPEKIEPTISLWKERVHPEDFDSLIRNLDRCLRGEAASFEAEYRMRHPELDWVWVWSKGTVLTQTPDGGAETLAGTHIDITRMKHAGESLRKAKEAAENVVLLRSRFLSDFSYELRSELNAVTAAAQMLVEQSTGPAESELATILVESCEKTFQILSRLPDLPSPQQPRQTENGSGRPDRNDPPRVLIAEDNPASRAVFKKMFAHLGYEPHVVANGLEAVRAIEQSRFDLVILDIEMPVMNGIHAAREIRRIENATALPPVPICAITAFAMPGDRERYLASGMNEYLPKPISIGILSKMLSALCPLDASMRPAPPEHPGPDVPPPPE